MNDDHLLLLPGKWNGGDDSERYDGNGGGGEDASGENGGGHSDKSGDEDDSDVLRRWRHCSSPVSKMFTPDKKAKTTHDNQTSGDSDGNICNAFLW